MVILNNGYIFNNGKRKNWEFLFVSLNFLYKGIEHRDNRINISHINIKSKYDDPTMDIHSKHVIVPACEYHIKSSIEYDSEFTFSLMSELFALTTVLSSVI